MVDAIALLPHAVTPSTGRAAITLHNARRMDRQRRPGREEKASAHDQEGSVLMARPYAGAPSTWLPKAFRIPHGAPDSRSVARANRGGSVKYRVTVLTPTLVGNGRKTFAIDYMVWRDQVNVLDQRAFSGALERPRLEGYLASCTKATKLDFASVGRLSRRITPDRRIP